MHAISCLLTHLDVEVESYFMAEAYFRHEGGIKILGKIRLVIFRSCYGIY